MINETVYDPAELVKDLADKIGIHTLYAIVCNIRGEGEAPIPADTAKELSELKAHVEYLSRQNESMRGEIRALAFAVRCNGVSGNEVRYD